MLTTIMEFHLLLINDPCGFMSGKSPENILKFMQILALQVLAIE